LATGISMALASGELRLAAQLAWILVAAAAVVLLLLRRWGGK